MRKVLLTGAGGFLGRHVQEELSKIPCTYKAIAGKADCDLRDKWDVEDLFNHWRPDVVIHLAAVVGGIGANQKRPGDFFIDNTLIGAAVLAACRETLPKRLIMVGTTCSYPKAPPAIPFREEHLYDGYPEETNAPYGLAKRALMAGAVALQAQYGVSVANLIPTNLYGPGDNFNPETSHVIPALIRRFLEAKGDSVTLWGSGTPTRDFLYVKDAAQAIVEAVEAETPPTPINLGSGYEVSIRELAYLVADVCGYHGDILWDVSRPDGQPRRALSTHQAERYLGWRATTSLREGLERTVDAYATAEGLAR